LTWCKLNLHWVYYRNTIIISPSRRSFESLRETRRVSLRRTPFLKKGRGFLNAAFMPAFGATSQALHAACHKDFVGSLNVKSTLTIGDSHHPMIPEAAVHASALHWVLTLMRLMSNRRWRLEFASSMLPEATIHASTLHWVLILVRPLKPTVLISEPLIISVMVCL